MGASKTARSGSSTPKARARARRAWVASSEWPPRSKKLSCAPTRSSPAPRPRRRPSRSSAGLARRGGSARRPRRCGRREGPAVHLAVGGERQRRQLDEGGRHHGRAAGRRGRSRSPAGEIRRRPARGRRRPRAAVPAASSRATTTASRTPGRAAERRLDLPRLDAEAADLDLLVGPAGEVQPRRPAGSGRGRRCGRGGRRARAGERIGTEALGGQRLVAQVAARRDGGCAWRSRRPRRCRPAGRGVDHQELDVLHAARRAAAPAARARPARLLDHVIGDGALGLGAAVEVDAGRPRRQAAEAVDVQPGEHVAHQEHERSDGQPRRRRRAGGSVSTCAIAGVRWATVILSPRQPGREPARDADRPPGRGRRARRR